MSNDLMHELRNVAGKVTADLAAAPGDSYEGYGLMKGKMGSVIYFYEMYKLYGNNGYIEKCFELLEELFTFINSDQANIPGDDEGLIIRDYTFLQGRAGLGFLLSYFESEGVIDEMEENLRVIDELLFPFALQLLDEKFMDFLQGTFGIVHYLVQRAHKPEVRAFLENFVDKYHAQTLHFSIGAIHLNNVGYLHKPGIDISLAHGVIGNYLVLLKVYDAGIRCEKIKEIITGAVAFITNVKSDKINNSFFPNYIELDPETNRFVSKNHSYRLAWCNGDMNIVFFLLAASRKFNITGIGSLTGEIISDLVLRKSFDETGIDETYFCHGTSGAAMMFDKLYGLTGNPECAKAKEYWIEQSFRLLHQEFGRLRIADRASFLFGWPGAVLAISSLLMKQETVMEKIFLINHK